MILTKKAKKDFLQWFWDEYVSKDVFPVCKIEDIESLFNSLYAQFRDTLIVEWLDAMEIRVFVKYVGPADTKLRDSGFSYFVNYAYMTHIYEGIYTRTDAIRLAIREANKIYNDKNFTKFKKYD